MVVVTAAVAPPVVKVTPVVKVAAMVMVAVVVAQVATVVGRVARGIPAVLAVEISSHSTESVHCSSGARILARHQRACSFGKSTRPMASAERHSRLWAPTAQTSCVPQTAQSRQRVLSRIAPDPHLECVLESTSSSQRCAASHHRRRHPLKQWFPLAHSPARCSRAAVVHGSASWPSSLQQMRRPVTQCAEWVGTDERSVFSRI